MSLYLGCVMAKDFNLDIGLTAQKVTSKDSTKRDMEY